MKKGNYTFILGWCKTGDGTSLTKSFQRTLHVLQFRLLTKNQKNDKIRSPYYYCCNIFQGRKIFEGRNKEGGEKGEGEKEELTKIRKYWNLGTRITP